MKEKIINYIGDLENKAKESDRFFKERNDLFLENERLNNILNDFNHRFSKIEGICNEMIKDRMYMNEYAIKRYAEEIKEIVFYYIKELKGDSSNE